MKRLYSYLVISYLGPFFITFFIALFVLVMQFLWKYVDEMVGKGLEWYIIGELLFYASANLVPLALPLAILLSSLMLFGNLGENFELVALKSSGIPLQKIMLPLVLVSVAISGVAFYFSNNIWPYANLKMAALLWDVREQKPTFNLKEGVFYEGIEDYRIKVGKKIGDKKLENIIIYDHSAHNGNSKVITAKSGEMTFIDSGITLQLTLKDGFCYDEQDNPRLKKRNLPHRKFAFGSESLFFNIGSFRFERSSEDLFRDHYQMLNVNQLIIVSDSLKGKYDERKKDICNILSRNYLIMQNDSSPDSGSTAIQEVPEIAVQLLRRKGGIDNDDSIRPVPRSAYDSGMAIYDLAINAARSNKSYVSALSSELKSRNDLLSRYSIEWHRKFTLSIACFILFFIGAPLGAIIRKGGFGMPVVVSSLLFILFHILSITGEKFAREGITAVWQGMWMPSAFFFPFGIILTWKAANDSVVMDLDTYIRFFKKLIPKQATG